MSHHGHHHSDKAPAYTGLIVSVIAILAVVVSIVILTNRSFEGHSKREGAKAGQTSGH